MKISMILFVFILLSMQVYAQAIPSGMLPDTTAKQSWTDKIANSFSGMADQFYTFINNISIIGMFIALSLTFLLFLAVSIGLYVWLPLKIYPTYLKYRNLISVFVEKSKL